MQATVYQHLLNLGWRLPVLLEVDDHFLARNREGVLELPLTDLSLLADSVKDCLFPSANKKKYVPDILLLTHQHAEKINGVRVQKPNDYKALLGSEFDCILIDAIDSLPAAATAALSGCIRAGGLLVIVSSNINHWSNQQVIESKRLFNQPVEHSAFIDRVLHHFSAVSEFLANNKQGLRLAIEKGQSIDTKVREALHRLTHTLLPELQKNQPQSNWSSVQQVRRTSFNNYPEQFEAINKIEKVFLGHGKRHLVLISDRGRGKSTALARAAANLVIDNDKRIAITSNSRQSIAILEKWLDEFLSTEERKKVVIYSPDKIYRNLITNNFSFDGLIVDEAAQIPAYWLEMFAKHCNRICFATTVHGYEGTGRGFALRFLPKLFEIAPQSKQITLSKPLRWSEDDILEAWSNNVFAYKDANNNANKEKQSQTLEKSALKIEWVSPGEQLNEALTISAFQLLVDSHYQTTPDDFRQLLDHPQRYLILVTHNSELLAVSMIVEEGLEDAALLENIRRGKRRVKGQLVSQALALYSNHPELALQKSWRIQRIVVREEYRRQHLAKTMLETIEQRATEDISYLSSSFALTTDLLQFWRRLDFSPIKVGLKNDSVTGSHNLMVVKPLLDNENWQNVFEQFAERTEILMNESLQDMSAKLAIELLREGNNQPFKKDYQFVVEHYLASTIPLNEIAYAAKPLVLAAIRNEYDNNASIQLLWAKLIQNKNIEDIAIEFKINGKKELESKCRFAVNDIYKWYQTNR